MCAMMDMTEFLSACFFSKSPLTLKLDILVEILSHVRFVYAVYLLGVGKSPAFEQFHFLTIRLMISFLLELSYLAC